MRPPSGAEDVEASGVFSPSVRRASTAIFTIMALSAFEGLAVAAALPRLAADLGGVALLPWVVTAYLLPSGVATVAAGALVDRLGVARVFVAAVVVFTVGGALAGLAPSMPLLIAARVLQGVGSGAVNAVGLAAVGLVYPRHLVSRAFAANATVWGVMSVAGPAIAAALLAVASWRWIFLVNIPLGAIALAAGWRVMPSDPPTDGYARSHRIRLDPLVLGLLGVVSFGALYAVDQLGWRSVPSVVVAVIAAAVLLRRERGRPGALIAPRHVIDAPLGPLAWGVCLSLIGAIGLSTFLPLYLTAGRGVGDAAAAWSVAAFTLGWTGGANASSRLVDRWPPVRVAARAAALTPLALAAVSGAVATEAPIALVVGVVTAAGAGVGGLTNAALTVLRDVTDTAELGRATAAHQFVRNLGFAMGNALVGAVLLLVVGRATGDVEAVREVLAEGADAAAAGAADVVAAAVAVAVGDGLAVALAVGSVVAAGALIPLQAAARSVREHRPAGG